ncbi:MAG: sulfatase [Deltaproteobacteria bacterium]|nr:sulfatase [Deltaproteobacteria bacterium]
MRFRTRRAALALALLLAPPPLAPTGAASERPAAERPALGWLRLEDGDRPNVLLITVDTLRADHVGRSARFPESFTPKLDALAKDSTVFRDASTTATATRPAIASLLTGLYPGRHPVRNNQDKVDDSAFLLTEGLARAGYTTASFYGNEVIGEKSGLQQGVATKDGFARYFGSSDEAIATRAIDWLRGRGRDDAPFFLWLHMMDPHGPYFSAPASAREQVPRDDGLPGKKLEAAKGNYGLGVLPRYQLLRSARDAKTYRWRYRAEVRWTDEQIGRVLAALDEMDLRGTTLVIVTADHGESLGEHEAYFQHGWNVFQPSAHVPLLFRQPGRIEAGRTIDTPVSLVDVLPTLQHGLALAPIPGVEGRDLSPLLHGAKDTGAPVFVLSACPNELVAVREGKLKLVHTPLPSRKAGRKWPFEPPGWRLYDLEKDSGELRDVSSERPEDRKRLRSLVRAWRKEHGSERATPRSPKPLDPGDEERLRQLGYID